jgi:predicted nucleic acid-binding protein
LIDFVVDASVLVELVLGSAPAPGLRRRVTSGRGAAPELIDLEALSVLRRLRRAGAIELEAAGDAARAFADAPLLRVSHRPLLDRVWDLRDVLTPYDAANVALAELCAAPLLTCDARLGRATGHKADIMVFARS